MMRDGMGCLGTPAGTLKVVGNLVGQVVLRIFAVDEVLPNSFVLGFAWPGKKGQNSFK